MCQQSPAFLRYWNFLENDLRMWIDPFLRWEEGDSLPVHQHLGTYILHLTYYTNNKYWKQARVVPWLLCYLGATLYRMDKRPDLVKLSAFICKHVYDAFIEHLNSVFKHLLPNNTALKLNAPVPSSSRGGQFVIEWGRCWGRGVRVVSRRSSRTANASGAQVSSQPSTKPRPSSSRTSWPSSTTTAAARRATSSRTKPPSASRGSLPSSSSTARAFDIVERMNGVQMKQFLDRIKYKGRSKLRVKDGTLKAAMHEAFDLQPPAPSA